MKLTKAQARRWIRQHWAEFIWQSDTPENAPEEAANLWDEENRKISLRILPPGRAALSQEGE